MSDFVEVGLEDLALKFGFDRYPKDALIDFLLGASFKTSGGEGLAKKT